MATDDPQMCGGAERRTTKARLSDKQRIAHSGLGGGSGGILAPVMRAISSQRTLLAATSASIHWRHQCLLDTIAHCCP